MAEGHIAAIILAAGKGTRMRSELPKVLHRVAGRTMLEHVLDTAASLSPDRTVVVVGPEMEDVAAAARPVADVAVQPEQLGTADAVKAARSALSGHAGEVVVLYGDSPLVRGATLGRLIGALRQRRAAVAVVGFRPPDPTGYGRLIVSAEGCLEAIVEERDASRAQRTIPLCNSGVMAFDGRVLFDLLDAVDAGNANGEYYLTDLVAHARAGNRNCTYIEADDADELIGVNSRAELAVAEAIYQTRVRGAAMAAGTTMTDPSTVYLSADTVLGRDVVIEPNVFFGPGVIVGDRTTIRAFSHLEGASIGDGAVVGPFARLRPGTRVGDDARVGNFVEVKNAVLGAGAKAGHLAYLGDADVGDGANIGAGTITCNYDGVAKYRTEIGKGAFIGSDSALVAPVRIGKDAVVGAGSVITEDVADGALAVARGEQKTVAGGAERLRTRQRRRAGHEDGSGQGEE